MYVTSLMNLLVYRQFVLYSFYHIVGDGHATVCTHYDDQKAVEESKQVPAGDDQHQVAHGHREADDDKERHEPADQGPTVGLLAALDPVQGVLREVLEQVDEHHQCAEAAQRQKTIDQGIVFQVAPHKHRLDAQVVVAEHGRLLVHHQRVARRMV